MWILYHLKHQGSSRVLEWVAYIFQGIFLTQELNRGLLHCRWILYQLSYQGSPVQPLNSLKIWKGQAGAAEETRRPRSDDQISYQPPL